MNNEISSKSFSSVIISDTPIVSIAGSTLSEITTTTTSTTTTPTPTSFELTKRKATDQKVTSKNPMSDAAAIKGGAGAAAGAVVKGSINAAANATVAAAAAVAQTGATRKLEPSATQQQQHPATAAGKPDETKKSESTGIEKLPENDLKKLLDEAYSYKCPKDKKDKSEMFLKLLEKVENEEKAEHNSLTSNAFSSSSHYSHSHHNQKQGGSLQNLAELPSELCESNLSQRHRRQNHNSRQKKYSLVSSRPREGGSLPSSLSSNMANLNMANCLQAGVATTEKQQQRNNARVSVQSICVSSVISSDSVTSSNSRTYVINCNDGTVTRTSASAAAPVPSPAVTNNGDIIIQVEDNQQRQQIMHSIMPCAANYVHVDIPHDEKTNKKETTFVDDGVIFNQIERFDIASSVGAATGSGAAGSITPGLLKPTASSSIPIPLDENYKSCKSIMGEKGENIAAAAKSMPAGAATSSTTATGSSASGNGGSNYGKSLPRQMDENGNSLSELAAQAGTHGGSSMPASSSASVTSSAQIPSQIKTKGKKKSQKVDIVTAEQLAGFRGNDPVEELVKYIESGEDNNNKQSGGTGSGKLTENNKKKERKKDKEKQNKIKKSNSLEELRSCAKINVDDLKRSAATTECTNVTMRSKGGASGNKSNKNNSASTVDINKNFDNNANGKEITTSGVGAKQVGTGANRKGERRSWGTEELQYLGESHNNNSNPTGGTDEKTIKEKKGKNKDKEKEKGKDKEKEKEVEKDKEKNNKDDEKTDKEKVKPEKLVNHTDNETKSEEERQEKREKLDKLEKRKKSTGNENNNMRLVPDEIARVAADMDAEFLVVTKKKKPKKQRVSTEEPNNTNSSAGFKSVFQLAFNTQKSTPFISPLQQHSRYKNFANAFSTTAFDSGNVPDRSDNHFANQHSHQLHHQQQQQSQTHSHHQQQQSHVNAANNGANSGSSGTSGDKLRRKSTSSMPPSEKSDSSDLDSVHSLPINSSTKSKSQRHKGGGSGASGTSATNAGNGSPASYADIAAAAAHGVLDSSNAINDLYNNLANASFCSITASVDLSSTNISTDSNRSLGTAAQINAITPNASKSTKTKRAASKPDFPELVASTSTTMTLGTTTDTTIGKTTTTNPTKLISYSQSLTTMPPTSPNNVICRTIGTDPPLNTVLITTPATEVKEIRVEKRIVATETIKADSCISGARPQPLQPHPHPQQQPLQKSKSVEHECYSFNSSNLDQQYPALEKTIKRHSATNVSMAGAVAGSSANVFAASLSPNATQFNFAAAAKQQINASVAPKQTTAPLMPQPAATTTSSNSATTVIAPPVVPAATTNVVRKSKEKSPTTPVIPAAPEGGIANVARKVKKDKQQQLLYADESLATPTVTTTPILDSHTTRKSTAATQTSDATISSGINCNTGCTKLPRAPINFVGECIIQTNAKLTNATNSKNNKLHVTGNNASSNKMSSGMSATTPASGNSTNSGANRPAVIILNDDRSNSNFDIASEFTFGDFNEDELKFFDDSVTPPPEATSNEYCDDRTKTHLKADNEHQLPAELGTVGAQINAKVSPTSASVYLNDSGADNAINTTRYIESGAMFSNASTSSPNTSFAGVASGSSNDSGIYVVNNSNNSQQSIQCGSSNNPQQGLVSPPLGPQTQLISVPSNNKLANSNEAISCKSVEKHSPTGTFSESKTKSNSESSSGGCCPMPQQLETCNDIETAIIAAARAAAEQQQHSYAEVLPQQARQQCQNSNSFSKSSSFSSSSSVSVEKHQHPHMRQHQYQAPSAHHNNAYNTADRSRSNSSSHSNAHEMSPTTSPLVSSPAAQTPPPGAVVVSVPCKEFNFIPPAPTSMSSSQHNKNIVEFIGSSWEEVARRTKFYDGQ